MASFNDVTFSLYTNERTGKRPGWRRAPRWASLAVPHASFDVLQFAGLGNPQLKVKVNVESDAAFAALAASVDGVARILMDPFGTGVNYAGVVLKEVNEPERVSFDEDWDAELLFEQKGGS